MARSVVRLARPTASAISETVIEGFSAMRLRMLFLSPSSRRSSVQKGSIARQNPVGGTMVKPGATIQVSLSAGPEKKEYTITVTCGAGGSVSPSGNQKVAEGGSVSFTITPKDGYEVATLVIDGTTVLPLTSYSFMNVDTNHTLYVTFREK